MNKLLLSICMILLIPVLIGGSIYISDQLIHFEEERNVFAFIVFLISILLLIGSFQLWEEIFINKIEEINQIKMDIFPKKYKHFFEDNNDIEEKNKSLTDKPFNTDDISMHKPIRGHID